jgi:hypothetical protein
MRYIINRCFLRWRRRSLQAQHQPHPGRACQPCLFAHSQCSPGTLRSILLQWSPIRHRNARVELVSWGRAVMKNAVKASTHPIPTDWHRCGSWPTIDNIRLGSSDSPPDRKNVIQMPGVAASEEHWTEVEDDGCRWILDLPSGPFVVLPCNICKVAAVIEHTLQGTHPRARCPQWRIANAIGYWSPTAGCSETLERDGGIIHCTSAARAVSAIPRPHHAQCSHRCIMGYEKRHVATSTYSLWH